MELPLSLLFPFSLFCFLSLNPVESSPPNQARFAPGGAPGHHSCSNVSRYWRDARPRVHHGSSRRSGLRVQCAALLGILCPALAFNSHFSRFVESYAVGPVNAVVPYVEFRKCHTVCLGVFCVNSLNQREYVSGLKWRLCHSPDHFVFRHAILQGSISSIHCSIKTSGILEHPIAAPPAYDQDRYHGDGYVSDEFHLLCPTLRLTRRDARPGVYHNFSPPLRASRTRCRRWLAVPIFCFGSLSINGGFSVIFPLRRHRS